MVESEAIRDGVARVRVIVRGLSRKDERRKQTLARGEGCDLFEETQRI